MGMRIMSKEVEEMVDKRQIIGKSLPSVEHRIDKVKSILIDTYGLSESDIETVVRVLQHYFVYHEMNAKKILEMIMSEQKDGD